MRRVPVFEIRCGVTRTVLLIARYAIKFPRIHECGKCYPSCRSKFTLGLHANRTEVDRWRRDRDARMARVILGCAFFVVMERCRDLDPGDLFNPDAFDGIVASWDRVAQNFGRTNDGRTVAVDYAAW